MSVRRVPTERRRSEGTRRRRAKPGAKALWLLSPGPAPGFSKVTRCKSGTVTSNTANNGYTPNPSTPDTPLRSLARARQLLQKTAYPVVKAEPIPATPQITDIHPIPIHQTRSIATVVTSDCSYRKSHQIDHLRPTTHLDDSRFFCACDLAPMLSFVNYKKYFTLSDHRFTIDFTELNNTLARPRNNLRRTTQGDTP